MKQVVGSQEQMMALGERIGCGLSGGEVIELVGDVGAGKTTLTKGIAQGLSIGEPIQSPTFTISRVYQSLGGLELRHYDFYRLGEAGIMSDELVEVFESGEAIVVVEWSGVVDGVLPADRLRLKIKVTSEDERQVEIEANGPLSEKVLERLG